MVISASAGSEPEPNHTTPGSEPKLAELMTTSGCR
jgi:hypothetical protein